MVFSPSFRKTLKLLLLIVPFVLPANAQRDYHDSTHTHDPPGCYLNGTHYPDGAMLPSDLRNPCEVCHCIRNRTSCVVQECGLKIEGCLPIYKPGQRCPCRYDCSYNAAGHTVEELPDGCLLADGRYVPDGEVVNSTNPCEHCYCMRNEVVCSIQECQAPSDSCKPLPIKPDQCCPDQYVCPSTDEFGDTSSPSTTNITARKLYPDGIIRKTTSMKSETDREKTMFGQKGGFEEIPPYKPTLPPNIKSFYYPASKTKNAAESSTLSPPPLVHNPYKLPSSILRVRGQGETKVFPSVTAIYNPHRKQYSSNSDLSRPSLAIKGGEFHFTIPTGAFQGVTSSGYSYKGGVVYENRQKPFLPVSPIPDKQAQGSSVKISAMSTVPGDGSCKVGKAMYSRGMYIPSTDPCKRNCRCLFGFVYCERVVCVLPPGRNCIPYHFNQECCPRYQCDAASSTLIPDSETGEQKSQGKQSSIRPVMKDSESYHAEHEKNTNKTSITLSSDVTQSTKFRETSVPVIDTTEEADSDIKGIIGFDSSTTANDSVAKKHNHLTTQSELSSEIVLDKSSDYIADNRTTEIPSEKSNVTLSTTNIPLESSSAVTLQIIPNTSENVKGTETTTVATLTTENTTLLGEKIENDVNQSSIRPVMADSNSYHAENDKNTNKTAVTLSSDVTQFTEFHETSMPIIDTTEEIDPDIKGIIDFDSSKISNDTATNKYNNLKAQSGLSSEIVLDKLSDYVADNRATEIPSEKSDVTLSTTSIPLESSSAVTLEIISNTSGNGEGTKTTAVAPLTTNNTTLLANKIENKVNMIPSIPTEITTISKEILKESGPEDVSATDTSPMESSYAQLESDKVKQMHNDMENADFESSHSVTSPGTEEIDTDTIIDETPELISDATEHASETTQITPLLTVGDAAIALLNKNVQCRNSFDGMCHDPQL